MNWFSSLSNWGRWGPTDERGTLNLVTSAVRKAAADLVVDGTSVSCSWDIEAGPLGETRRLMTSTGEGLRDLDRPDNPIINALYGPRMRSAGEYLAISYHGLWVTHLDAPGHIFWDGQMYNGRPSSYVTASEGALSNSVTVARDGIFARGVLADVAQLRGVPWLNGGDEVYPEDIEAVERAHGFRVGPGDALFVRTGVDRKRRELGRWQTESVGSPGLQAACLPWLRDRGVALIGSDSACDVIPSGYDVVKMPIHAIGIAAMGLWLIDNCDLQALTETCAEKGRWEFFFTCAPLSVQGGTGSPVNPLALF